MKTKFLAFLLAAATTGVAMPAKAESGALHGTYQAILNHEKGNFFQFATFNLRTVNLGNGNLKISGSSRIQFGDWNSNEFTTYEYPEVVLNILTQQISMKSDTNDVSFIGFLRNGQIEGEWFSSNVGRLGTFKAQKDKAPEAAQDAKLVRTATGYYVGTAANTNPASNLPEKMTLSLVTSQEVTPTGTNLKMGGSLRFYLGEFDSVEFIEARLTTVEFNFFTRYLTAKTDNYGITLKGVLGQDGQFEGEIFAEGLGKVGNVKLKAN